MNTDEWTQTLGAGPLLGIAAGAVAVLLLLIITLRVHAFLALVAISLATAFATGIPAEAVVDTLTEGFGSTLASVALLVGFGAMLGRLLEVSGGAQALTDALIRRFGEKRAPLALGVASLLFGFPIFFDAGLVVMLPIIFSVARRLGGGVLRYGLPAAGAFSVMHVYVPPHPGPVAASTLLGADVGLVIAFAVLLAVPTWYLTSYLYGLWVGKRIVLPVPDILGETETDENPPSAGTVIGLLLLPPGADLRQHRPEHGRRRRVDRRRCRLVQRPGRARVHTGGAADHRLRGDVRARHAPRPRQDRGGADPRLGARTRVRHHPHHRRRWHVRWRAARERHRRRAVRRARGHGPARDRGRLRHRHGAADRAGLGHRRPHHRGGPGAAARPGRRVQLDRGRGDRARPRRGLGDRGPRQRLRLLVGGPVLPDGRQDDAEDLDGHADHHRSRRLRSGFRALPRRLTILPRRPPRML
ncbi:gluconate transporter [Saccharomonospora azurea SZMC 14600]|nr:gluconate transporter [Saccharomonospora azurea SZMC 14600]